MNNSCLEATLESLYTVTWARNQNEVLLSPSSILTTPARKAQGKCSHNTNAFILMWKHLPFIAWCRNTDPKIYRHVSMYMYIYTHTYSHASEGRYPWTKETHNSRGTGARISLVSATLRIQNTLYLHFSGFNTWISNFPFLPHSWMKTPLLILVIAT